MPVISLQAYFFCEFLYLSLDFVNCSPYNTASLQQQPTEIKMNFKKLAIVSAILPVIAFSSVACAAPSSSEEWAIYNYGNPSVYSFNHLNKGATLAVEIGRAKDGSANVYFTVTPVGGKVICNKEGELRSTIEVNGTLVRVARWCNKYTNSNEKYASFTASTTRGEAFIVDTFKTSNYVNVDFGEFGAFDFTAKGFTKYWNKYSNAL